MTPEKFGIELRNALVSYEGITLVLRDDGMCPEFDIVTDSPGTARIKGYYCESGDSFLQISSSGREVFTQNDEAARRFIALIAEVVNVVIHQGCVETQWIASDGTIKCSMIDLPLRSRTYRFGKSPRLWHVGLRRYTKHFVPGA